MGSLQWGRMLQVELTLPNGAFVRLVEYDSTKPADHQGLACTVEVTRHVLPEAQPLLVTVYNLAPALLTTIIETVAAARAQSYITSQAVRAGRLTVRAGRTPETMRKIADDIIVNVTQVAGESVDVATVIEAEDGRLQWESLFVEASSPADGLAKLGSPLPAATGPAQVTYSASGGSHITLDTQAVIEALGYRPVMQGDTVVWLPIDGSLAFPSAILDTVALRPIAPEGPDGTRSITALYDSMYQPGLRAVLQSRHYAMDEIKATLSTYDASGWTATLALRSIVPTV